VKTLTEFETLEAALAGRSIARFGDGEYKLAVGSHAKSQRADPNLAKRLRTILANPDQGALVCVPAPNAKSPKYALWKSYDRPPYSDLIKPGATYGSAFITRPDSAPWIDTPAYWDRLSALWRGREIVLVRGSTKSFTGPELKADGCDVEEIVAPRQHAFAECDGLFRRLRHEKRRVLLALGATATVLAYYLAQEGVHAIDGGHGAMFMRREGRFDRESFPA